EHGYDCKVPAEGDADGPGDEAGAANHEVLERTDSSDDPPGAELSEEGDDTHPDQVREDPDPRDPVDLGRVGVELEGGRDEHEDVPDGDGHHQGAVRRPARPVDDLTGADEGPRAEDSREGQQVG